MSIEACGSFVAHEACCFYIHPGPGDGKLNTLILANGPVEHDAFTCVLAGPIDEPITVANAFSRNQSTLGIEAIQDIFEPLSFFANQVFLWNFEIFKRSEEQTSELQSLMFI